MIRQVPNVLTGVRLLLAAVFFVILSWYQYQGRGDPGLLNWAFGVYVVALATDFLDGYLARRWGVESVFGRIVDPLVDKVLVLGSFIFFAGKNFVIPAPEVTSPHGAMVLRTITGVTPGIVIILLLRELLVTSLRGGAESGGQSFAASMSGKVKMTLQSVTILAILGYVNYRQRLIDANWKDAAQFLRDALIWATVVVTAISGLMYVRRAVALFSAAGARAQ